MNTHVLTSEAARLIGISERTLRQWDRLGRVNPERTSSGVRLFSREECLRLAEERRSATKLAATQE